MVDTLQTAAKLSRVIDGFPKEKAPGLGGILPEIIIRCARRVLLSPSYSVCIGIRDQCRKI